MKNASEEIPPGSQELQNGRDHADTLQTVCYAITIFLSASLLFSVQPMFGKMVLPLLGGSPSVWNTCMFFFQFVLLLGYLYAYFTTRWLTPTKQLLLHVVVVSVGIAILPLTLRAGWTPPESENPSRWLVLLLGTSVGIPFFAISTTTPLLQRWFSYTKHSDSSDPYFLYSISNLGSLIALLSYPILVEPAFSVSQQSGIWSGGYYGLIVMVVCCGLFLRRQHVFSGNGVRTPATKNQKKPSSRGRIVKIKNKKATESRPENPNRQRLRWIALSFVPSSWMLGVTTYLTTDVAPIPMLWVIPFALYLVTFILVFARREWLSHRWLKLIFPCLLLFVAASLIFLRSWHFFLIHLGVFFVAAMVCHGELVRSRPRVSRLTDFYLCLSIGGMLGGLFNGILAPAVFSGLWEYPITIALGAGILNSFRDGKTENARWVLYLLFGIFVLTLWYLRGNVELNASEVVFYSVVISLPILMLLTIFDRPRWFAVSIGLVLLSKSFFPFQESQLLYTERSYYGIHLVSIDRWDNRVLTNGNTLHGIQSLKPTEKCKPQAFYHRGGPLGDVFSSLRNSSRTDEVAIIGLGTGATVCYQTRPDQKWTFFEIDPVVKHIAEDPRYFTYLIDCAKGKYEIVLGDGRLNLEKRPDESYGIIILDAFSSDAIPVHLLTREAIRMYFQKLKPGGFLVFHISNRHLDLKQVLGKVAEEEGWIFRAASIRVTEEEKISGKQPSTWALLSKSEKDIGALARKSSWNSFEAKTSFRIWTDGYSNLLSILRWSEE